MKKKDENNDATPKVMRTDSQQYVSSLRLSGLLNDNSEVDQALISSSASVSEIKTVCSGDDGYESAKDESPRTANPLRAQTYSDPDAAIVNHRTESEGFALREIRRRVKKRIKTRSK